MNDRFQYLSIKYIDGNLSSAESDELVSLVKGNKAYQKELAEMLVQDAAIQNVLGSQSQMEDEVKKTGGLKNFKTYPRHNSRRFQSVKKSSPWPMLIIAALVFLGVAVPMLLFKKSLDEEKVKTTKDSVNGSVVGVNKNLAKVVDIVGDVYRTQNGKRDKLALGMDISLHDEIESGSGGFVFIQSPMKSMVVMSQNSKLEWKEKGIHLSLGDLFAEIKKNDLPSLYHFSSPDQSSINITGTAFEWSYSDRHNSSVLKVGEGTVEFNKNNLKKNIKKFQMLTSLEFDKEPQKITLKSIAPWYQYLNMFRKGDLYFFEDFRGEKFNDQWKIVTTQTGNHGSSPRDGLFCSGKNNKIELEINDIVLDGVNALAFFFADFSIKAHNSVEYGYEIWNEEGLFLRQGYVVTQIDEFSYHIKETRNINNGDKLLDQINYQKGAKQPNGNRTTENTLPHLSFLLTLNPTIEETKSEVSYQKGELLSDIKVSLPSKLVKVKFYLKTLNENSKANWSFRNFAIGKSEKSFQLDSK